MIRHKSGRARLPAADFKQLLAEVEKAKPVEK
jgi:hypothetical protein